MQIILLCSVSQCRRHQRVPKDVLILRISLKFSRRRYNIIISRTVLLAYITDEYEPITVCDVRAYCIRETAFIMSFFQEIKFSGKLYYLCFQTKKFQRTYVEQIQYKPYEKSKENFQTQFLVKIQVIVSTIKTTSLRTTLTHFMVHTDLMYIILLCISFVYEYTLYRSLKLVI